MRQKLPPWLGKTCRGEGKKDRYQAVNDPSASIWHELSQTDGGPFMLAQHLRDPYGEGIARCKQLARAGEFSSLEQAAKKLLKSFPKDVEARHLLGIARLRLGKPGEAARLIRKAAKGAPKRTDILSNLGVAEQEAGNAEAAIRAFRAAIKHKPDEINALSNLAALLRNRGAIDEAIAVLREGLDKADGNPDLAIALAETYLEVEQGQPALDVLDRLVEGGYESPVVTMNRGIALSLVDRHDEAIETLKAAIAQMPNRDSAHLNLSVALKRAGREREMVENINAVDLTSSESIRNLGTVAALLMNTGDTARAKEMYHRLVEAKPDFIDYWTGLGTCYKDEGLYNESLEYLRRGYAIDPKNCELLTAFGGLYFRMGDLVMAEAAFRQAFEARPDLINCYNNLLMVHSRLGSFDRANLIARMLMQRPNFKATDIAGPLAAFRFTCDFDQLEALGVLKSTLLGIDPQSMGLTSFNLMPSTRTLEDNQFIYKINRRWGEEAERRSALTQSEAPAFGRRTGKLRIGFLSSDLRHHAVAKHIEPLLRLLDRERFELFAYVPYLITGDEMQEHLRTLFEDFVVIGMMSDQAAADRIRDDGIDILIDLNGLTRDTRVAVMAFRPAPVQCTWLGYPLTTGLEAMDYFLLDRFLVPTDRSILIEEPWVLDGAWLCSVDHGDIPAVHEPPVTRNGYVTFGTLNNAYKFTRDTLRVWSEVLKRVPNSRFLLVQAKREHGLLCQNLAQEFIRNGVDPECLLYVSNEPEEHMQFYNQMDLSLDTLPQTGGTTTNEALWMGVPVVSLQGLGIHQRLSHAILSHVGLSELSVETEEDFVEAAVALANDVERLTHYRQNLRAMFKASPLRDEEGFAERFGDALIEIAEKHNLRG